MRFDNSIIRFDMPDGWIADESSDGNIFVTNAEEPSIWVSIELGGVRKGDGPLSALDFATSTYQDKLTLPESGLNTLKDGRVILHWREILIHEGEDYALAHAFIAKNQGPGDLQLIMLQSAAPANAIATPLAQEAERFVTDTAQDVFFYPWR